MVLVFSWRLGSSFIIRLAWLKASLAMSEPGLFLHRVKTPPESRKRHLISYGGLGMHPNKNIAVPRLVEWHLSMNHEIHQHLRQERCSQSITQLGEVE